MAGPPWKEKEKITEYVFRGMFDNVPKYVMPSMEWTVDALVPKIEGFLEPLLDAADFDLDYDIYAVEEKSEFISPDIAVNFEGDDIGLLLNQRGELLLALEQLTLEALRIPHEDRYRIIFDANDYRMLRIEELRLSAETAAQQVITTGRLFAFGPMTSRERRIIHLALRDHSTVTTTSEGVPPQRRVVVYAKGSKPR